MSCRGPRPTHTCVPLVDMANHVAPREASNAEIRGGRDGQVAMYAKKQVRGRVYVCVRMCVHLGHYVLPVHYLPVTCLQCS